MLLTCIKLMYDWLGLHNIVNFVQWLHKSFMGRTCQESNLSRYYFLLFFPGTNTAVIIGGGVGAGVGTIVLLIVIITVTVTIYASTKGRNRNKKSKSWQILHIIMPIQICNNCMIANYIDIKLFPAPSAPPSTSFNHVRGPGMWYRQILVLWWHWV